MLTSVKIQKRQSEIRQSLAALVGKDKPDENEIRALADLDSEYQGNETRFRAALVIEDTERREAKGELETRSDKDYAALIDRFEMRQVAQFLDTGDALHGETAEVVQEMRSHGSYRGMPVPWQALEQRAGETIASGTPSPLNFHPIIDRLFPSGVTARMGGQMVTIACGTDEYPVVTSAITAGWAASETGTVAAAAAYATTNRALAPSNTLGVQMRLTRKTMKQSGDALEQAVRRDMAGAIGQALDAAVFLGTGATGQPLGVIPGQATYGITTTAVAAQVSWAAFRTAVTTFMIANAATSPSDVNLLIRPEVFNKADAALITNTAVSEWDRLTKNIPQENIAMSSNALAAPTGSPLACSAVLTTAIGGVAPIYVGLWGGVDLIRDIYSDAASGILRLTGLVTADVTVSRAVQLQLLTNVQVA
jgi:HK97 family phage major capsid protein